MKYTLKDIRKSYWRKPRPLFNKLIEPVILFMAYILVHTPLTANMITFISLIFVILSAISFFYGYFFLGALFYLTRHILDYVDGTVAQLKHQTSKVGALFDNISGIFGTFLCIVGLIYSGNDTILLILIPLLVLLSVVHVLHQLLICFWIKPKPRKDTYIPENNDVRLTSFVFLPIFASFVDIKFSLLLTFTLTTFLVTLNQLGWVIFYKKELRNKYEKI